jgi:amino acid permease
MSNEKGIHPYDDPEKVDTRAPDADAIVLSQVEEEGLKRGLRQRHISMMALAGELISV